MITRKAVRIANGGLVHLQQVESLPYESFCEAVLKESRSGSRMAAYFGVEPEDGPARELELFAVLAVTLGPPSARANRVNYQETLLTIGPPLALMAFVLFLGLYLPEPVRQLVDEAVKVVEVAR